MKLNFFISPTIPPAMLTCGEKPTERERGVIGERSVHRNYEQRRLFPSSPFLVPFFRKGKIGGHEQVISTNYEAMSW